MMKSPEPAVISLRNVPEKILQIPRKYNREVLKYWLHLYFFTIVPKYTLHFTFFFLYLFTVYYNEIYGIISLVPVAGYNLGAILKCI
jgi:hypothetical protein